MSLVFSPQIEQRRTQMFPTLSADDIARLQRFGERHFFPAGTRMMATGEISPGLFVIHSGTVQVQQRIADEPPQLIVEYGPNHFMGELAQLSNRPSLVDAQAATDVDALVIPSRRLRDVLVENADLGERIMRALILRRVGLLETGSGGPVIVGHSGQGDMLRLENFLARNGHPHQRLDPDVDSCARTLVERFHIAPNELPIVLCPNGQLLRNPSENELARCIGLVQPIDPNRLFDVAIVGAGPAGLAAAVYAGSEGLCTIVLDCRAFGGQAGASSRIENYMGFPTGISGMALMARAYNQAQKFGVEVAIPDEVSILNRSPHGFTLDLANGETLKTRAVVIASGARYRKLNVSNMAEFEGTSIHYWASPLEARLCTGQEVALVGAGNSAGQGAVFLASQVNKVWMIVRGKSLEATMSSYLVERIRAQPNIEVLTETEIFELNGKDGILDNLRWRNRKTGEESLKDIRHLFLFIGAEPNTDWLASCDVLRDEKGFIRTDTGRPLQPLETSIEGVFAIGDVRAGSVKRVAASVGEGAQVVAALHAYLAQTAAQRAV
ncbi:MAG TPA: FAD-dependent oxidoreductase [Rhizomicrobium sp.]|nr:FAD-dependent oxidoreductase [Rhizomicrobium sp.]